MPNICDIHPDVLVSSTKFNHYGKMRSFWCEVVTVKCFVEYTKVKDFVSNQGKGKVLVVDCGASKRH